MPDVKFMHVVTCSSQDPKNPASNLIAQEAFRKWKGIVGQPTISVVLQLEKSCCVRALDIGNDFSAFIEVLVGRSTDKEDEYQVLLPAASFMNPNESRSETNGARVRMFTSDNLVESTVSKCWDRIKVICQQPFNKKLAYGLAFIRVIEAKSSTDQPTSSSNGATVSVQPQKQQSIGRFLLRDEPNDDVKGLSAGSMFKNKQANKEAPDANSGSASAIRNAPQPKPSTPSTFVELSSKRRKTPEPKPAPKRKSSDVASSSTAKIPRQKSPSRNTPISSADKKQQEPQKTTTSASAANPPPVTPKIAPKAVKKLKRVPFDQLLSGVTFALSGFVNPKRGELREKALEMGAKFRPDWQPGCTHLICAFANTPKFNQVRGRGTIVKKEWIEDCHSRRRRLPWRRYALDRADQGRPESEDEIEADDDTASAPTPGTSTDLSASSGASPKHIHSNSKSPSPSPYTNLRTEQKSDPDFVAHDADDSSTDVDSEASNTDDEIDQIRAGKKTPKRQSRQQRATNQKSERVEPTVVSTESPTKLKVDVNGLPLLPDFFADQHFFLFGKKLSGDERKQVTRFVTAYGGVLEQYMDPKLVTVVITKNEWDENFDQALTDNPKLNFVKPQWIIDCGNKGKLLPIGPYTIEKP